MAAMEIQRLATIPNLLQAISGPPTELYHAGAPLRELLKRPKVAIVGSRAVTPYGKDVTRRLARELAEQGVVIISGLALGVDGIAHRAAIEAGGLTIAVLPTPITDIYPAVHSQLADQIVAKGGALISEYPAETPGFKTNFIARNRLIAGLADIVIITEATDTSGSLYTAKFAAKQGKPVMVVPGNITSPGSAGTNKLLKSGALVITSSKDVLKVLGIRQHRRTANKVAGKSPEEQLLIDLLLAGVQDGHDLWHESKLPITTFNQVLINLEIADKVRNLGGNQWSL